MEGQVHTHQCEKAHFERISQDPKAYFRIVAGPLGIAGGGFPVRVSLT